MNIGKATAIFKNIHNEETEVEDKLTERDGGSYPPADRRIYLRRHTR